MTFKIKQDLEVSGTGIFAGNISVPNGTLDDHAINKLQFDTAIAGLGTGGGSPGGSDGQVQYNNGGAFGGSAAMTFDGFALSVPNFSLEHLQVRFGGFGMQSLISSIGFLTYNAAYSSGSLRRIYDGSGAYMLVNSDIVEFYHFFSAAAGTPTSASRSISLTPNLVTIDGDLVAKTIRAQSYTLAALNSTYPSPTVGQRSFITDETTGASHAAAVGGGGLERPVYYGNGTWRIGG